MVARSWCAACAAFLLLSGGARIARAGVVNPDISVIGQPRMLWSDDAADPGRKRATLDIGETEFVFDAYLNPYARGTFVAALGDEGFELEEGYFQLLRGLPGNLALKGGKYRVGFGKLNPAHPHTYPFAERFRVLAGYLPGEESFNETALQVSEMVPLGDASITVAADWLQGDSFRIPRESSGAIDDPLDVDPDLGDREDEPRPGALARIAAFLPIDDRSGVEIGVSGARGTNNVAAATRTTVLGGDLKVKLWTGPRSYLLLQSEVLRLDREDAGWEEGAGYTRTSTTPAGGYLFADYNWDTRYNAGVSYERYQRPDSDETWDAAFGVFAGLALMEETTAFRIGWERFQPGRLPGATEDPEATNQVTLRVIFSMGPHKAHQF
jgi:hypothetical protein